MDDTFTLDLADYDKNYLQDVLETFFEMASDHGRFIAKRFHDRGHGHRRRNTDPKTPTTTNEKARVHPASPAQDRGRHAMRPCGFIARFKQCLIQVKVP